ncbi:uncharacterized protein LOC134447099 [Engraulis encrasicolus]|uniref:uncharacterized protein LOC134447099 n=1 Tax=Engraulis encrasicolus TaxID=184585 RepID=UPI002FCF5AE2
MDTALLLERQEREAESSQTLSDHTSATQLLRLQVEDLQKRLQEKDHKLSEAQQALLLETQEREAESSQTLSDHTSATQLLRLQVEDLQKRLQEKDHKLSEAQQALLLETQEREAESSQTLSDHTSATQLLRLQVEDLQKRLQEKEDKLSEAQQVIRGLRDEILVLQRQLKAERRKSQDAVQKPARKPHKVQLKRVNKDAVQQPARKSRKISLYSSPSSEHVHTALSDSLHNDATSARKRLSLRSSVRLEDWGPKLDTDGVFLIPPVEQDDDDDDDDDIDDIDDDDDDYDDDYIPEKADGVDDIHDDTPDQMVLDEQPVASTYEIVEAGTKRGRPQLVDNLGYCFSVRHIAPSGAVTWRCTVRPVGAPCKAIVVQRHGVFKAGGYQHNHGPNLGAATAAKVVARVKREALSDLSKPASAIVKEVLLQELDGDTPCIALKREHLMVKANRHRKKMRPDEWRDHSVRSTASMEESREEQPVEEMVAEGQPVSSSYEVVEAGTKRGRPQLVDNLGYCFSVRHIAPSGAVTWRCTVRPVGAPCKAIVVQRHGVFKAGGHPHNHAPNLGAATASKVVARVKREVALDLSKPASAIVQGVFLQELDSDSPCLALSKPEHLVVKANRYRKKMRPDEQRGHNAQSTATMDESPEEQQVGEMVVEGQPVAPTYEVVEAGTKRGRPQLIDNLGYCFSNCKSAPSGAVKWRCTIRPKDAPCKAIVVQHDGVFKAGRHQHNHAPNTGAATAAKVVARVKREALSDLSKPASDIVQEVLRQELDGDRPTPCIALKRELLMLKANRYRKKMRLDEQPRESLQSTSAMEESLEEQWQLVEEMLDGQPASSTYKVVEDGTKRGRPQLIDNLGYCFGFHSTPRGSVQWRCTARPVGAPCGATVVQGHGGFKAGRHQHNHAPNLGAATAAKVNARLKREAVNHQNQQRDQILLGLTVDGDTPCPALAKPVVLALLLETQEREAESSQTLSDHISATELLRLQVEDLQKRLQEKDHKLSEAQQVIRGLRDEILDLQRQLEAERRKSQDAVQQPARKPHKVQLKRVYKISQPSSPSSKNQHSGLTDSLNNDATPARKRLSLGSSVRLEDWGPKLNPDGVLLFPPAEHDDDDDDDGDINNDNDYIPDEADDINNGDDYTVDRQRTQKKPRSTPRLPKQKEKYKEAQAQSTKRTSRKARVHECSTCGKRFAQPCLVRRHERIHTNEKPYPCGLCGKSFGQEHYVTMHFKRCHDDEERSVVKEKHHQCQECGKMFSSSSNLKVHQQTHTGEKPFSCKLCDKSYFSLSALRNHENAHADVRPFMCSECGQGFTSSSSLTIHRRKHSGERPYQCSQCPKAFPSSSQLHAHVKTHSGEKTFACLDCGLTFLRASSLSRHKITHTGVRRHLCPICGKSFGQAGVLKTHLRVHTGEKPHCCTICGETFSYVQMLQTHQKRTHCGREREEQASREQDENSTAGT